MIKDDSSHCESLQPDVTFFYFFLFFFHITKIRLYTFNPLKPHFYIVKLGFTGIYIINEYPQSMFWTGIWKLSDYFIWKFSFFDRKFFNIFE